MCLFSGDAVTGGLKMVVTAGNIVSGTIYRTNCTDNYVCTN